MGIVVMLAPEGPKPAKKYISIQGGVKLKQHFFVVN
jgi:hypothetical protein